MLYIVIVNNVFTLYISCHRVERYVNLSFMIVGFCSNGGIFSHFYALPSSKYEFSLRVGPSHE